MSKFWLVAFHEYARHVLRKRFLFAILSVPLFIAMIIGLIFVVMLLETNSTPVGYVDFSGLLANPIQQPAPKAPERLIPMIPYQSEAEAQAALDAGKIQAYYLIPKDYLQSGEATIVYTKEPKGLTYQQFNAFLAVNLLASQPKAVADRINAGTDLVIRSPDSSREASEERWFSILLPFFIAIIFVMAMGTTSGYLMQAVAEEKENRTMEVIITSVSPNQFMSGKIVADIAIGLTQLLSWAVFCVLAVLIGRTYVSWLQGIAISWDSVALTVAVMAPAFVMYSALQAGVGAMATDVREAQQMTGLFSLPLWFPFMLLAVIMENPNGGLAVLLSFFPLTAPITLVLRDGFAIIPIWQLVVCEIILVLSALGCVWLAGRAFRLGMLRYGKRLRWSEIFSRKGA